MNAMQVIEISESNPVIQKLENEDRPMTFSIQSNIVHYMSEFDKYESADAYIQMCIDKAQS